MFEAELTAAGLSADEVRQAGEIAQERRITNLASLAAVLMQEHIVTPAKAQEILDALAAEGRRVSVSELIGRTLGRFKLLRRLGRGTSGSTWLGEHDAIGLRAAIKVLHRTDRVERLREEAMRLAKLQHPNIVSVQDFGVQDGIAYLVMPYVEGAPLNEAKLPRPPLQWATLLQWMLQISRALEAIHLCGMVHRDLKPTNILVTPDGSLKLIDFGLVYDSESTVRVEGGTPGFMAPEQVRGEKVDGRADLYALGATVYALIAGRSPFQAATPAETIVRQMLEPASPGELLQRGVPQPLVNLLMTLLEPDPKSRPSSARDLGRIIVNTQRELADALSADDEPPPMEKPKSLARPLAGIAVVIVIAVAIAAFAMTRRSTPEVAKPPEPVKTLPAPVVVGPPEPDERQQLLDQAQAAETKGNFEAALDCLRRAGEIKQTADIQTRIAMLEDTLRTRLREQSEFEKLNLRLASLPDEAGLRACDEFLFRNSLSRYGDTVKRWRDQIQARISKTPPKPTPDPTKPTPQPEPPKPVVKEKPPAVRGREMNDKVLDGLLWLARHQNEDGSWSMKSLAEVCKGKACTSGTWKGGHEFGVTALAALAYLGAGYRLQDADDYDGINVGESLRHAVFRLAKEWKNAVFVEKSMYDVAIAVWVFAEAVRSAAAEGPLTKDDYDRVRTALNESVDWLVAAQSPGKGWRYTAKCADTDASVTAWVVLALDAARRAGVKVPAKLFADAAAWVNAATDERSGITGYTNKSTGKVFVPGTNESYLHHPAMTAAGLSIRRVTGTMKPAEVDVAVKQLLADPPNASGWSRDYYYWFHATYCLKMCSPTAFEKWKQTALVQLELAREKAGCAKGSWAIDDRWTLEGGRVFAVAINTMTMELLVLKPFEPPKVDAPKVDPKKPEWVVFLKSGGRLKALSVDEQGDKVVIQLATGGTSTLSKDEIERVAKYDSKLHD